MNYSRVGEYALQLPPFQRP